MKKLKRSLIHTFWPGHGEDDESEDDISDGEDEFQEDGELIETQYLNGNNEVVKVFNQKCGICLETDSDYAFSKYGHQCICEQGHQNKGDIDKLKCVVCRAWYMCINSYNKRVIIVRYFWEILKRKVNILIYNLKLIKNLKKLNI